eukprot:1161973-Pelagomonas_calceolata.AAC.9
MPATCPDYRSQSKQPPVKAVACSVPPRMHEQQQLFQHIHTHGALSRVPRSQKPRGQAPLPATLLGTCNIWYAQHMRSPLQHCLDKDAYGNKSRECHM